MTEPATPSNDPAATDGTPDGTTPAEPTDGATFTQADVDKLVGKARTEERRKAGEKFADYDDLKAKASGAKTLEDRLADLETTTATATQRAQRAEIAAEFGISTKRGDDDTPSDAELFLTGTDDTTLRAQAKRFADSRAEDPKKATHVPSEGRTPTAATGDEDRRAFVRNLTGRG